MDEFLKPNSIFQVISSAGILILCLAALFGRVRKFKFGKFEFEADGKSVVSNEIIARLNEIIAGLTETVRNIEVRLVELKDDVLDLTIDHLEQAFYDVDQKIEKRIFAGLRFIKAGGNGDVKRDVVNLIKENRAVYTAICISQKNLKLRGEDFNDRKS